MRRLTLMVHISLDGFVAGLKGELDGFDPGEENLGFVCKLTEDGDAALFGRTSYELLEKHWPTAKDRPGASPYEIQYSNWYNNAQKIVFSRTMQAKDFNDTIIIRENIYEEMIHLKKQEGKEILIFGSPSVSQLLMQLNLIDSYWIFINPAIFGEGIPLFTKLTDQLKLKLVDTKQFANGEIALNFILDIAS